MKSFKNILWGIILIVVGVILGLNSLGITNIDIFFDGWWTLFIIVPCFIGLITNKDKTGDIIGLVVGVLLLLASQDIIDFDVILKLLLPIILIILGVSFIFKNSFNNKVNDEIKKLNKGDKNKDNIVAIMSGQDIRITDEKYEGYNLTAIFGGINLDLRDATIEKDIVINAVSVFGGTDILVPDDVKVKVVSSSIFGGVDQKKKRDSDSKKEHTIYINATCVFGGVDIK